MPVHPAIAATAGTRAGLLHGFLNLPAGALEPVERALDLLAEELTRPR